MARMSGMASQVSALLMVSRIESAVLPGRSSSASAPNSSRDAAGWVAGVLDGAGAVPVGPRPHVAHVAAEQRRGVHAGGQRGGGLLHPPRHLAGVRDGADEVGGAADRLGRVLTADRHAPP